MAEFKDPFADYAAPATVTSSKNDAFGSQPAAGEKPYSYGDTSDEDKSGDTWKAVKSGVQSGVVGPALAGGRYLAERNGATNLTTIFKNLGISSDEYAQENIDEMSPAARKAMTATVTSPEFWEHPLRAARLKAANMSPGLAATLVPATIMGGPVGATLMAGVANGALSAGAATQEIYKKIDETSDEDLRKQVPFYDGLRDLGMDEKSAREKFNQTTQGETPLFNLLIGTGAGVLGPVAGAARVLKGGAGVIGAAERGVMGRAAVGATEGAGVNAVQGGAQNVSVQDALMDAGLQKKFDASSLGNALVEQMAVGAIIGGGAGAATSRKGPQLAPKTEPQLAPKVEPVRAETKKVEVVQAGAPNADEAAALAASQTPKVELPKAPDVTPQEIVPAAERTLTPDVAAASDRLSADPVTREVIPEDLPPARPVDNSVPETVEAASDRVAGEPRAPRVLDAQDDAAKEVRRQAREVQDTATPQLAEKPESTGKNWTKAQLAKREKDAAAAKQIFDEEGAIDGTIPKTVDERTALRDRVTRIVERAEEAGISLKSIKAYDTTADHMVYLREAADLKKTLDKKGAPPITRDQHIASFLGRERAAKAGDFSIMRAERKAEGELAKRKNQGDVEQTAAPTKEAPAVLRMDKDLASQETELSLATPEKDAVVVGPAVKSRTGTVRGVDAPTEKGPIQFKNGSDRAVAASEVKKIEVTPEREREALAAMDRLMAKDKFPNPKVTPKITPKVAAIKERTDGRRLASDWRSNNHEDGVEIRRRMSEVPDADGVARVKTWVGERTNLTKRVIEEKVQPFYDRYMFMAKQEIAFERWRAEDKAADAAPKVTPKVAAIKERVAAAAKAVEKKPTEAQIEAGNYPKGHVSMHGLDIAIETPRGGARSGTGADGKPWSVKMADHYGYIKRTKGADGDHVDVYIGKHPESKLVFLIDQNDHKTQKFDEHKAMLGFKDATQAMEAYEKAFSDGKGFDRIGLIKPMTMDEFKAWLEHGNTTKPAASIKQSVLARAKDNLEDIFFHEENIKPIYTTTGDEVLKGLKLDHLDGPAKALQPFLMGRMGELARETKFHIVSNEEMAKFVGHNRERKGEAPYGMFVPDDNPAHDYIALNIDRLGSSEQAMHTVVHEVVHKATMRGIHYNEDHRAMIRSLMIEAESAIVQRHDGAMPKWAAYAMKDEHEFIAEAFSNEAFQQLLSELPLSAYNAERIGLGKASKPTMWDYFVASVRKILRGLGVPEGSFSQLEGILRVGESIIEGRPARWTSSMNPENVRPAPRRLKMEPAALDPGAVKERISDLRTGSSGRLRGIKDKLSSTIMLGNRAEHFLPGAEKVVELRSMMEREKTRILQNEGGQEIARDIAAYERERGAAEFQKLAEVGFDASNANVNLGGGKNDHLGKDSTKGWQAKARLPELEKRFNALPAEGKELLTRTVAFFKKLQNDIALQDIKNILKVAGVDEAGLAERIHRDGMTDADQAKFKTNTVVNALNEAHAVKQLDGWYLPFRRYGEHVVNSYHEVKAPTGAHLIGKDTVQFQNSSDAAARREAQKYVEGHDLRHVDTKKVWVDKNDPTKAIEAEHVDAIPAYRVTMQHQTTEFFDSEAMARRVQEDLVKNAPKYGVTQVDGVRKRSDFVSQSGDSLSGQMHTVMSALEKQTRFKAMSSEEQAAVRQTINEASVRVLGSTRLQSTFQQRRNVAGYSEDLGRVTADYARAATGYLAKLRFQPRIDEAFGELHKYNDEHKYESSDRTIRRDELVSELRRRIYEQAPTDAQSTMGHVTRRLLQISRLDKLAGVSFHVINSQEPWTTSLPVIGGRHGFVSAARTLGEAYNIIGARAGITAGIRDTGRAFMKDNGFADYLAMFKDSISTSPMVGGKKAERLKSVLDYMDNRGIFNDDAIFEVGRYADPTKGAVMRALDRADLMANQVGNAVEKINRTVTGLTAYELEFKKNGGNHEAAMHYAYEVTHDTMGDYSSWNSSPYFKSNAGMLALQFKKFAHKTYYLLGNTLRGTLKGDPEAAKQFIGLMVTHATVAGALGLPIEPFKVALLAANAMGVTGFTYQDFEMMVRVKAAEVLGQKGGEMFSHGLTRGLGVETSARQGLDSLMTFGSPSDPSKVKDLKAWLFDTVAGAPAGWLLDQIKSAQALSKGDFAKAAELSVPIKGFTDAWKAVTGLDPKLDAKGRTIRAGYTPYEAGVRALGFTPATEAENFEQRAMFSSASKQLGDARAKLINDWVIAKPADKGAALKAAQEWSKDQPANVKIMPKDLLSAAKRRASEPEGIRATKRNKHILEKLTPVYGGKEHDEADGNSIGATGDMSRWPTNEDADLSWKNDMRYGTTAAGAFEPGSPMNTIQSPAAAYRGEESPTQTPIDRETAYQLHKAWIGAQRSSVSSLGFDPRNVASWRKDVALVEGDTTEIRGFYTKGRPGGGSMNDYMAYNRSSETTPVHESMHRGIQMLRAAGKLPDFVGDNVSVNGRTLPRAFTEEAVVRALMMRHFGNAESNPKQMRDAKEVPDTLLDAVESAGAQLISKKSPRGPR